MRLCDCETVRLCDCATVRLCDCATLRLTFVGVEHVGTDNSARFVISEDARPCNIRKERS